jgi:hypothetical protein
MASPTVTQIIADFFDYAPKLAAFEAGSAVTIPIAPATYDLNVPDVGTVAVSESGSTVTIQKKA